MSDPKVLTDTDPDEKEVSLRRKHANVLSYTAATAVASATAFWIFERFLSAQYGSSEGPLSSFLSQIASDLLQVGLPLLIGGLTVFFTWVLGTQAFKGIFRKYFGVKEVVGGLDFSDVTEFERAQIHERLAEYELMQARFRAGLGGADVEYQLERLQHQNESLESKLDEVGTTRGLFNRMCTRLNYERGRLSGNSRTNLFIGITASLLALGVLGLPLVNPEVLSGSSQIVDASFWRQYATRLPVGLLLQFVAFFFLRLYVACEMDIKSNKNEITNIEAKYLAYLITQSDGHEKATAIVQQLAETERNFILKKDERTIGVENDSRFNDLKESVDKVLGAVSGRLGNAGAV